MIAKQDFLDDLEAEFCSTSTGNSVENSPKHSAATGNNPTSLDDNTASSYFNALDMSPKHKIRNEPSRRKRSTETEGIPHRKESSQMLGSSPEDQRVRPLSPTSEYNAYAMEDLDLLPTKEELVKCVDDCSPSHTTVGKLM